MPSALTHQPPPFHGDVILHWIIETARLRKVTLTGSVSHGQEAGGSAAGTTSWAA